MPIIHPIPPVCFPDARVLILGSFPSVKSREVGFYYGHPQNRFWRVLAAVLEEAVPTDTAAKIAMLRAHRIALFDVIASCTVQGSSDSSITDAVPNDLTPLLSSAPIRAVFTNGSRASALYAREIAPRVGARYPAARTAIPLPSTSAANAAWSLERLIRAYAVIRTYLDG